MPYPDELVNIHHTPTGKWWRALGRGITGNRSEAHVYARSHAKTLIPRDSGNELIPVGIYPLIDAGRPMILEPIPAAPIAPIAPIAPATQRAAHRAEMARWWRSRSAA